MHHTKGRFNGDRALGMATLCCVSGGNLVLCSAPGRGGTGRNGVGRSILLHALETKSAQTRVWRVRAPV